MCGICGVLNNDSSKIIDRDTLVAMNESLFHRGPDDQGYFIRGNVGLGMRRLSIIDIKGGNQPIYNENKTICVVCNGEIYNYIELRNELEGKGHRFSTNTDVEVIAHLYEEYGQDLVQKLRGMFAFALYDLSAKKLILGRDRLGIKPLYYSFQKGILLFASELKAILRYPGLERKLSYEALSDYLTYLYIPSPETIYENIYKLPPAHLLVFKNKDFALNQYWEIDYRKQKEQREEYYLENFNDLLRETIKMHLMSEVPLGAFLSGGVDSSSIVALMAEVMDSPVKTFSVGFDVSDFNELKYAKLLANRFNTEHHEINLMPDIINILPKLVSYFDEPFADSSAIPTYLVSEFAKKRVTVCLAGDGGDELFAGYGWTRRQKFIDDYNCLPRVIRRFTGSVFLGSNYVIDYKGSLPEKMKRFFYDADMPLVESFMRRRTCFSETMKKGLFNENINRRLSNYRSISKISPYFERNKVCGNMEKLLFVDTKTFLPEDGLCKVDRMSMLNSLEVRVPFLDHKVVEFVSSMPFKLKMRGRQSKYILKKVLKNKVPAEILKQRKLGFTIPLNSWFRNKLSDYSHDLLFSDSRLLKLVNAKYIKWILDEHIAGRQSFGSQIYALVVLELWLRESGASLSE